MGDSTNTVVRADDGSPANARDGVAPQVIEVRLPADSSYVSLLRTTTAALAARLRFTVDEIEDLRIAVDEACAMLLSSAHAGATVTCTFDMAADTLNISLAVPSRTSAVPSKNTFGWTVLSALAGGADAGADGETSWISLHKRRSSAES